MPILLESLYNRSAAATASAALYTRNSLIIASSKLSRRTPAATAAARITPISISRARAGGTGQRERRLFCARAAQTSVSARQHADDRELRVFARRAERERERAEEEGVYMGNNGVSVCMLKRFFLDAGWTRSEVSMRGVWVIEYYRRVGRCGGVCEGSGAGGR